MGIVSGSIFNLDFKDSTDFSSSGVFTSSWFDSKSAGYSNALSNYVATTTVPSNCAIYWEFRTANLTNYSDATSWASAVTSLVGRFVQVRGTLYKSDSATSGAVVSDLNVYSTPQGSALMVEESTTNLAPTPDTPSSGDITVTAGSAYTLSIFDNVNPTGVVTIAHKNVETLTADFSTGTLTGVTASSDSLTLDTAIADPTFARATAATKRDGTAVASGAARYEDIIRQFTMTTQGDFDACTKVGPIMTSPAGSASLGTWTDGFDADTSWAYTVTGTGGTPTATWNTASGRLEFDKGTAGFATIVYNNHSAKNTAVEAYFSQAAAGGLILRYTDSNNFYIMLLSDDTTSAASNLYIYKKVAGTDTLLTGPIDITFTRGTSYKFRFEAADSILKVYVNDVLTTSTSDGSLATAGKVGFYSGNVTSAYIHSFTVDQATPLFGRNTIAYNPQTGASVAANVPRYTNGKNLLTKNQSDIETDLTGITAVGLNIMTRDTSDYWQGTASLKLAYASASGTNTGFRVNALGSTNVAHPNGQFYLPSTTYTASFYAKATGTPVQMRIFVYDNIGAATLGSVSTFTPTSSWVRYSHSFTTPASGAGAKHYYLRVDQNAVASSFDLYIDGLQIEQGSSATTWVQGGDNAILIEEGTTNMFAAGIEGFVSGWAGFSGAVATVTSGQVDPFGGTSAYRIQTTGGTSISKYYTSAGTSVNLTKYSESIWIKNVGTSTVVMHPNLTATVSISNTEGWKLLKNEGLVGNGSSTLSLYLQTAASGDNLDVYVMWPQLEAKAYCTSYITPGTTRNADNLVLGTYPANTSDMASGSVIMRLYSDSDMAATSPTASHGIIRFDNGSNLNVIRCFRNSGTSGSVVFRVTNSAGISTDATWTAPVISVGWHTWGFRWSASRVSLYFDGVEKAFTTSSINLPSAPPTINYIGTDGPASGQLANGGVDDIAIFTSYLSDAEMVSLTTNS